MSAKPNKKARFLVMMLAMALIAVASARVEAQSYDASNVARMSQVVDEAYVLGKDDLDWSYVEPNLTLEKGDLLRTNESGMAEIHFDSTLVLRIGEDSRAAIVEMGDEKVIGVENGRVYLRATKGPDTGQDFFVTFPSGQLFTVGPTLARIDVHETGAAELRVVRGEIGLVTKPDGARSIPAGGSVSLDPEGKSIQGAVLVGKDDAFDYWSEQRDIALSTATRPEQIPKGVVGAEDMDEFGDWVYSDTYKTEVWKPYVVEEWRPYSNGRWTHSSSSGWTWVPVEPWGYTTHHYGSWNYDAHYGWIWVPGATWHPARVSWVEYESYVGWVPVGHYGYPVVTTYPYYVSTSYVHHPDLFTFTFVLSDHFYYHHNHHGHHRHGHHGGHHGHHNGHHGGHHGDGDGHHGGGDGHHGGGGGEHGGHHGGGDGDGHNNGGGGIGEGENNNRLQRWEGGTDGKAGNRYTEAERKEWRKHIVDGDKVEVTKLKDAKLRFASNADNLNLAKSRQKGVTALQKVDHEKIVDVAGRPELKKKVARLNSNPRRTEKIRTTAASKGLPKKVGRDKAKNFDFRGSDLKIDKGRAKNAVARKDVGKISPKAAKRSVKGTSRRYRTPEAAKRSAEGASRRYRTPAEINRQQSIERVKQARKSSPAGQIKTPSVRRITITDNDLKQTAMRFKRERDGGNIAGRKAPQVAEQKSKRWSSEIRDTRQGPARERLSKRSGTDNRQAMGAKPQALRERSSTQRKTSDSARTGKYDRFSSRENQRARPSRSSQSVKSSSQTKAYPSYRREAATPQFQRPGRRSYGEAARSRSFDRSNRMRSTQQMSRPTGPTRGMSQPQINSPQPSRGGARSISGRSGGGSHAGNRSMRGIGRSRAHRR
jgi:hypothetical protein